MDEQCVIAQGAGRLSVRLPVQRSLEGYRVGVVQLDIPRTWVDVDEQKVIAIFPEGREEVVTIPAGHYGTTKAYCDALNHGLRMASFTAYEFYQHPGSGVVAVKCTDDEYQVQLSAKLTQLLHLPALIEQATEGARPVDIAKHRAYLHADFVQATTINNTSWPLLCSVPLAQDTMRWGGYRMDYVKLKDSYPEYLNMWLVDEDGRYINFVSGSVFVKLQFIKLE